MWNFESRIIPAGMFIVALVLGILAAPLDAVEQQPAKVPRIGYLSSRPGPSHVDEAFRQGLRELGYTEGND